MTHWGPWLCKVIKLRLHLRLLWSKTGIENCWQFCRKLKHPRKSKNNGSFFTPISPPWYFRSKAWLCFNRIIIFQSFSSLPSFWIHVHVYVWFFGCVALRLVWTPCFNPSQGQAQEARCQNDDMFGQALILKKGRNTAICLGMQSSPADTVPLKIKYDRDPSLFFALGCQVPSIEGVLMGARYEKHLTVEVRNIRRK